MANRAFAFHGLRGLLVGLAQALMLVATLTWTTAPVLAQNTQVAASLVPNAKQQFFNANGQPLAGGFVYSYVPNTLVAKTTWVDPYENVANAQPVVLDSGGYAFIFGQGNYRQQVYDANMNLIWDGFTQAYASSQPSGATGTDTAPVGTVMPFSGFTVPTNWMLAYGEAVSRTTYADLLAAITIVNTGAVCSATSTTISGLASTAQMAVGEPIEASCLANGTTVASITSSTTITVSSAASASGTVTATVFPWGNGDGTSTFNLPDLRGRTFAGADAMGGTAASRLTSTYYGASAASPGVAGGSQSGTTSTTLASGNIPQLTFTPAGTIGGSYTTSGSYFEAGAGSFTLSGGSPNGFAQITIPGSSFTFTGTPQTIGNASPSAATSAAFATIQPSLTVNYIIKVAPNTSGAGGVVSFGGMTGDIVCGQGLTCEPIASVNTAECTIATTSVLGCVQPDGSTITVNGLGVISVSGSVGVAGPGSSTVGHFAVWNNSSGSLLKDVNLYASAASWSANQTFGAGNLIINGGSATAGVASVTSGGVVSSETAASAISGITLTGGLNLGGQTLSGNATFSGTDNFTGTFQASGNTMTFPASAATLPGIGLNQSWTAAQRATPANVVISTSTFTPNFNTAQNFELDLGSSCPCTLANPSTTLVAGQSGVIEVHQDSSGSRLISTWGSDYQYSGGTSTITLSTAANAVDYLPYYVNNAATGIVLGSILTKPTH